MSMLDGKVLYMLLLGENVPYMSVLDTGETNT